MAVRSKPVKPQLLKKITDLNRYNTYSDISKDMTEKGFSLSAHTIGDVCRIGLATGETVEKFEGYFNLLKEEITA